MVLKRCGILLAFLTTWLAFFALMSRVESAEDMPVSRIMDLTIGFLFAVAFLLTQIPGTSGGARRKYRTALSVVLVWGATSGPLLLLHEGVARVRFVVGPKGVTRFRVESASHAVKRYTIDCGSPPSEEQGLNALYENPGVQKWRGPYLEAELLTDAWGNALRYSTQNGRYRVWSCGPDGLSGTADDIVNEQDSLQAVPGQPGALQEAK